MEAEFLGMAAGAIALAAFVPYVYTILFGKTRPNRATWIIWTVAGFMLAWSYWASVEDHTYWVAVSYFVGPCMVMVFSYWYGEGGMNKKFDCACLAVAFGGAMLWLALGSPLWALRANLLVDVAGVPSTIRKTYKDPESENIFTWFLFFVANSINLSIAESWHPLDHGIYPVVMFLGSACMVAIIFYRRLTIRSKES